MMKAYYLFGGSLLFLDGVLMFFFEETRAFAPAILGFSLSFFLWGQVRGGDS